MQTCRKAFKLVIRISIVNIMRRMLRCALTPNYDGSCPAASHIQRADLECYQLSMRTSVHVCERVGTRMQINDAAA